MSVSELLKLLVRVVTCDILNPQMSTFVLLYLFDPNKVFECLLVAPLGLLPRENKAFIAAVSEV
jgi:hypothetical protein